MQSPVLFQIFSNLVSFCPNFQIFCTVLLFLNIFGHFLPFFRETACMSSLSRGPAWNIQEWQQRNHAIFLNKEYPSLKNKEMEPVQPVKMNKDLSWLHFNDEPSTQERQKVKHQQSCISVFVAYLTIPSNNQHQPRHGNIILCMTVWQIHRDTEQPQEKET